MTLAQIFRVSDAGPDLYRIKKKKIMFVMKSKLKKTYESWMKSVIQSYINLFLIKTQENVKIGTLFPTLLERKKKK